MVIASKRNYAGMTARRRQRARTRTSLSVMIMAGTLFFVVALALYQMMFMSWISSSSSLSLSSSSSSSFSSGSSSSRWWSGARRVSMDPDDPLCSSLFASTSDPLDLWRSRAEVVLNASQHDDDPGYSHRARTVQSLDAFLSVLEGGGDANGDEDRLLSRPRDDDVDRLARSVRKRLVAAAAASDGTSTAALPPPIRVVVVGGAAAEGVGCPDDRSVVVPKGSIMTNPLYCAWPYRLQTFLNKLAGFEMIRVTNMAETGTETALMTPLLRNGLWPSDVGPDGADVVINAYASVDYGPRNNNNNNNQKNIDKAAEEMKTFVETLRGVERKRCDASGPIVLHLYDADGLSELTERLGVMSVRHGGGAGGFGIMRHVSLTWSLAYRLTEVLSGRCAQRPDLSNSKPPCRDDDADRARCPLAWFAGPAGTVFRPTEINRYLRPFRSSDDDGSWEARTDMEAGFDRKAGLTASAPGATLELVVPGPVRYLNLMVVRHRASSERWRGGVVECTLTSSSSSSKPSKRSKKEPTKKTRELTFKIRGDHDEDAVATYPVELDLKDYAVKEGGELTFRMELAEGSNFKIIGMLFCP